MLCQKEKFNLDPNFHYINGAYMSPLLQAASEAGVAAMRRKERPNTISPQDFFTESEQLRALFAQLVNAHSAQHVAFVPSVSYGMGIVAKNLPFSSGQNIVVTEAEFPSNVYPWMRFEQEEGGKLRTIAMPNTPGQRGPAWNDAILEAIDENTALVAISHCHWANGIQYDLKAISDKVHQYGGLLVVDGTQSVGAMPIDVQAHGIDALICGGYKWLMGSYSLGYAYFSERFHDGEPLEENWINRRYSEDFTGLTNYQKDYQSGALRFDVGEHSNFALVPVGIAAISQLLEWGANNIQTYCHSLTAPEIRHWEALGYRVEPAEHRAAHLLGIELPAGSDPIVLQQRLRESNIGVSVRGGFVRVSPNVYNDEGDMLALRAALG